MKRGRDGSDGKEKFVGKNLKIEPGGIVKTEPDGIGREPTENSRKYLGNPSNNYH